MSEQKFKFVQENRGIGKTSGKPYHNIELHDTTSFQNLNFRVDPMTVLEPFNYAPGQDVVITGVKFVKQFDNTVTLVTSLNAVSSNK